MSLLSLLVALPASAATASVVRPGGVAASPHCAPAPKSAVPPDYLFYHALVAPHAALSDRRSAPATCAARRVVRT